MQLAVGNAYDTITFKPTSLQMRWRVSTTRGAMLIVKPVKKNTHLGLHTLSWVNVAEISPFLHDATDKYLKAYFDLAVKLDAEWIVVHGDYHFSSRRDIRKQASIDRLKRIVGKLCCCSWKISTVSRN